MVVATKSLWLPIKDGDGRGRAIYNRHYSCRHRKDGRKPKLFIGPGEKLGLLTLDNKALFCWRLFTEIGDDTPRGINCAVFRNEGPHLSSELILDAEEWAIDKWRNKIPMRFYTLVNSKRVRSNNPGYCFLKAGWQKARVRKGGLIEFEKWRGQ